MRNQWVNCGVISIISQDNFLNWQDLFDQFFGLKSLSKNNIINSKYMTKKDLLATIPNIKHSQSDMFFLMAGPCAIESEEVCMRVAEKALAICDKYSIPYIFKGSYRKANRSRRDSFSGIGDVEALEILSKVNREFGVPTVTDIHSAEEAQLAAEYVDVLQIPAFLCRQTDILTAAAKSGKVVNIKKGQFLAPESMTFAAQKIREEGNERVILTDRGSMFGYHDMIVDFRGIPIMQECGAPVVMDITHSLQQPNQTTGVTGGKPQMIETIAKGAIAVGVDGLFIETHPEPSKALSDGANMLQLDLLEGLIEKLVRVRNAII